MVHPSRCAPVVPLHAPRSASLVRLRAAHRTRAARRVSFRENAAPRRVVMSWLRWGVRRRFHAGRGLSSFSSFVPALIAPWRDRLSLARARDLSNPAFDAFSSGAGDERTEQRIERTEQRCDALRRAAAPRRCCADATPCWRGAAQRGGARRSAARRA